LDPTKKYGKTMKRQKLTGKIQHKNKKIKRVVLTQSQGLPFQQTVSRAPPGAKKIQRLRKTE